LTKNRKDANIRLKSGQERGENWAKGKTGGEFAAPGSDDHDENSETATEKPGQKAKGAGTKRGNVTPWQRKPNS